MVPMKAEKKMISVLFKVPASRYDLDARVKRIGAVNVPIPTTQIVCGTARALCEKACFT